MAQLSTSSRIRATQRKGKPRLELENLEERMLLAWSPLASLPTALQHMASVTGQDGKIYVFGGSDNAGHTVNTVEIYNPADNTWSAGAHMPTARFDLAAAVGSDGKIYAIGGDTFPGHQVSNVEIYNPTTNTWTTAANLATPREQFAAVTGSDGRIYVLGGHHHVGNSTGADVNLTNVEVYTPSTNTWGTAANLTTARAGLAATLGADGHIYIVGGATDAVDAYNPTTDTWTTVSNMPTQRTNLAAVTGADGNIYTIGGLANINGQTITTVEAYNPSTNSWAIVDSLPTSREFLSASVGLDGKIYAIGGTPGVGALGEVLSITPTGVATNPNQLFLTRLYQDLLNRPVDASGLKFWADLLDKGMTSRGVVSLFVEATPEFHIIQVQAVYSQLLNRAADQDGLSTFVNFLNLGGSVNQVKAVIMNSNEYFQIRGRGANTTWLDAVYHDVLGRAADEAGKQTHLHELATGQSRGQVAVNILASLEADRLTVVNLFNRFLQHGPQSNEADFFVNVMQRGLDAVFVEAALLNSTEYLAHT